MNKTLLYLVVFFYLTITTNSQNIQNGSMGSREETKSSTNGKINLKYSGMYFEGQLAFIYSIDVSYSGFINNKKVDVVYNISSIDKDHYFTYYNFSYKSIMDHMNFEGSNNDKKLIIKGSIIQNNSGSKEILATFSDLVFIDERFKGWAIAENSKIGISNTSGLSGSYLTCSSDDIKFSGKSVAFFLIEPDFSLKFVLKPTSLVPINKSAPHK